MNRLLSKKTNKLSKKKGFTLVELIIVIAIIAILAAIAIPKFGEIRNSANEKADIATAKNIATVVANGIANDEITVPDTADTYDLNAVGVSGKNVLDVTTKIDGGTTPKAQSGTFSVKIKSNGDVSVQYTGGDFLYGKS